MDLFQEELLLHLLFSNQRMVRWSRLFVIGVSSTREEILFTACDISGLLSDRVPYSQHFLVRLPAMGDPHEHFRNSQHDIRSIVNFPPFGLLTRTAV